MFCSESRRHHHIARCKHSKNGPTSHRGIPRLWTISSPPNSILASLLDFVKGGEFPPHMHLNQTLLHKAAMERSRTTIDLPWQRYWKKLQLQLRFEQLWGLNASANSSEYKTIWHYRSIQTLNLFGIQSAANQKILSMHKLSPFPFRYRPSTARVAHTHFGATLV